MCVGRVVCAEVWCAVFCLLCVWRGVCTQCICASVCVCVYGVRETMLELCALTARLDEDSPRPAKSVRFCVSEECVRCVHSCV
jgi:hypothetical protein